VITSPTLIDASITDSFHNISNLDIFMNVVKADLKDVSNISVEAKSLEVTYNTIKSAGLWSLLFIIVLPLAVLIGGFVFWFRRRKL
jgi:ABC-2 type transport system permease protein